ncbi:MAG: hypothetical protein C0424_02115 [Sphingobacteriaceae bacterium]|nr:hypothetical protein [Sphingobacteriaceae bacterium]
MKNLILVLLALPGWVAAQTDSSIRYIKIVDTAIPLILKEETSTSVCHLRHIDEKGIQTEPHWCHDHSHCIHQHRHRVSEAEQAAACAKQCQHHANYKLKTSKEGSQPLQRAQKWPMDIEYPEWTATLPMPFPFYVYGQQIGYIETYDNLRLSLLNAKESEIMDISMLNFEGLVTGCLYDYDPFKFEAISYELDGQTGERIMKIQFLAVRKYYSDTLIVQSWLHELDSKVSLHYVKMPVNRRDEHPEISIWASCEQGMHQQYFAGLASHPTTYCASQLMCGIPENGTVLSLSPVHLVLPERKHAVTNLPGMELRTDAQTGMHHLAGLVGSDTLHVFDSQGKLVRKLSLEQARAGFHMQQLAAGMYILTDPLFGNSVRILKP